MNLQVEEGIPNWLTTSVILACASPAVTLNVWPRIEQMASQGFSSNAFGIVLLVTLSAIGMTSVPFAMKKAGNWGFWWICLVFGIGLGILNYTMAVGAVGKTRDDEAGTKRTLIEKASSLKDSLQSTLRLRQELPAFRWTTKEMVDSAALAVRLTDDARRKECEKVGDYCRALVAQLGNRQGEYAEISSSFAATQRATGLDDQISSLKTSLGTLGPIPETSDQQASRLAAFLGTFLNLGPTPAERVATGLIHFLAICAEAFALGMPRIIVTALAKRPEKEKPNVVQQSPMPVAPSPMPTKLSKTAGVPKTRTVVGKPEASITDWRSLSLIRSTGKIRDWEAFEHYKAFSAQAGLAPASFQSFRSELQKLGLRLESDPVSKRDFFLETAIKAPLKAVS